MRGMILVAGASLAIIAAAGSGALGQSATSRNFAVAGFTAVELAGSDDVEVRVGPAFSVRAEGPAAVLDRLIIERRGEALWVSREPGRWSWSGQGARVFVTMPRIAAAKLSGSGNLNVDRVSGPQFAVASKGSGNLRIGALAVDRAEFAAVGSGVVRAAGTAGEINVALKGSGDVDLGGLVARSGQIALSGSGNVRARVNGPAQVALSGSGDVDLGPGARCQVVKAGSGEVRCGK